MLNDSWKVNYNNIIIIKFFYESSFRPRTKVSKHHSFYIQTTCDLCTVNKCEPWKIGPNQLNMIPSEKAVNYLGLRIDLWIGTSRTVFPEKLDRWIERTGRAPLKTFLKLEILNVYILPRIINFVDHARTCKEYYFIYH